MNILPSLLLVILCTSSALTPDGPDVPKISFDCDPLCADTEFCGSDLQCHGYSCEAWYELAHPFFTGVRNGTSRPSLFCESLTEDRTFLQHTTPCRRNLPLGAEFVADHAASTSCFYPYRDEQLATYFLNRKCTAQPSADTGFACYDMNPNTNLDSYTAAYVDQTKGQNGTHRYKLYVEGFTLVHQNELPYSYDYPSHISELRSLGEGGDKSTFNLTAAQATMYSSTFWSNPALLTLKTCDQGCRLNEFCGEDLLCHEIDCENFWMYGPNSFTGFPKQDDELICSFTLQNSSVNPCESDWPMAVQYLCRPKNVFPFHEQYCTDSDRDLRHLSFHRMCTAKPNPDQEYVCFDMKGIADMGAYAEGYIQSTTENPECSEQEMTQPMDGPYYHWLAYHGQTHRVQNYRTSFFLYHGGQKQRVSWEPLDLFALEQALFSRLVGQPSQSPEDELLSNTFTSTVYGDSTSSYYRFYWNSACILLSVFLGWCLR